MNQQQDSQESLNQFEGNEEQHTLSSPWSIQRKGRTHKGLKSEHPSTYEESIPPQSYRAQDQAPSPEVGISSEVEASPSIAANPGIKANSGIGADPKLGTSSGDGAGPRAKASSKPTRQYTGGWQVPSWARSQQNKFGTTRLFIWFIIGVLAIPLLYFIVTVVIPLVVLLVLIILGFLLLAATVIAILWAIGKLDGIKPPQW